MSDNHIVDQALNYLADHINQANQLIVSQVITGTAATIATTARNTFYIDAVKEGYTPLGIGQVNMTGSNTALARIASFGMTSTETVWITVENGSSSSQTWTPHAVVIYKSNKPRPINLPYSDEIREKTGSFTMTSVSSSQTWGELDTLPVGTWIINMQWNFPSNSTGTRSAGVLWKNDLGTAAYADTAASGTANQIGMSRIITITDDQTDRKIYLYGRQNSGSSMSVSYKYTALRVGPLPFAMQTPQSSTFLGTSIALPASSWPYTATTDGFMIVKIGVPSSSNSYFNIKETYRSDEDYGEPDHGIGYNSTNSGANYSITVPIKKGRTYSTLHSLNANVNEFLVYPIYNYTDPSGSLSDVVDDISSLENKVDTVITGAFTPVSGVTASEIQVKQVGKTVMVKGYVTKSGNFTAGSNIKIGNISGVDLPASNIRTVCGAGPYAYSATNSGYIILGSTGQMDIQLETNKPTVDFCITYLAVP